MKYKKILSFMLAIMCIAQLSTSALASNVSDDQEDPSVVEFSLPVSIEDAKENFANFSEAKIEYSMPMTKVPMDMATIVGQVYDMTNNVPIAGATVEINNLAVEIVTDDNGAFEVSGVPEGQYNVEVSANGYDTAYFNNMPAYNSSGAEFYYLPLLRNEGLEFDYAADITSTMFSNGVMAANGDFEGDEIIEPYATSYALKNYTVNYNGNIYSFGKNINNYLYCVVPNEMVVTGLTSAQAIEAYKAQAVASRGYADGKVRQGMGHQSSGYSLCATTCCQVFLPYYTNSNAIQAVNAVNNQVLTYDGYRSITEFHGKCKGTVINYPKPGNTTISDKNTCTGHTPATDKEYAHNRGMCQTGAALMAKSGKKYQDILKHYYASCELITASSTSYEGINPGETIRFSSSTKTIDFLTYAPIAGNYTISVGQAGSTAYATKIEVHKVTRNSSHDVTVGSLVNSSTSGSLTIALAKGTEYRIRITCTSGNSMSGMLSVKCNAASHSAGTGISSQGKYEYFVVGVVEKVFKFTPSTTGTYTIQTTKPGNLTADTYLELRNSSFGLITSDDNSGSNNYSSITTSLTKGTTYYIVVQSSAYHSNPTLGANIQCGLKISMK